MSVSGDNAAGRGSGGAGRRVRIPEPGVKVIERARLSSLLDTADVAMVEAPAGYGKTTLVAAWARSSSAAVAWLTLTRADGDPARFLRDLVDALRVSEHSDLQGLPDLEPSWDEPDASTLLGSLHQVLAEGTAPLTLVVDDVDAIADAPRSLEQLNVLAFEGPDRLRVILSGRRRPPLRMSALSPGRALVLIDRADLAFTPEETARVLRAARGPAEQRDVEDVQSATGGWPVAVQLCVLGARPGQRTAPLRPGQANELTRYLVSEVLDRLGPEERSFVLDASIDDAVCPGLLDRVRGSADSAARLGACYERALFLTLDGDPRPSGPWYRWHDLFVTHVRRVALEEDPVRRRTLHGRAAQWWGGVDTVVAVHHALQAGRAEMGAVLAADAWPELVLRGMNDTVGGLLRELPEGGLHEAELHLAAAFVEANRGDSGAAGHALHRARRVSGRLPEPDRARFDARATALSLLFAATGEQPLEQTVQRGRELLRRIENGPWTPDSVTLMLTRLSVGIGVTRLQLDHDDALPLLQSAAAIAERHRFSAVHLVAIAESCLPLMAADQLSLASRVAQDVVTRTQRRGWEPPRALAPALYLQGWCSYWRGELVEARAALSTVVGLLRNVDPVLVGLATYLHGLSCLRAGDTARAVKDLESVRAISRGGSSAPYWSSLVRALEAETSLARGEGSRAHRLAAAPAPGRQHPLATTSRARVLACVGDSHAALSVLRHVATTRAPAPLRTEVLRIRALAHWELGDVQPALHDLDAALEAGERDGLLLPFRTDWDRIEPMVRRLGSDSAHPEMLARVLAAASEPRARRGGRSDLLTEREVVMLRHLQSDLTLAEMAAAEYVSINTVKTHVGRIYRKLDVEGRRDAVRAARDLGIV